MTEQDSKPAISVIIPTYNHQAFVLDAINSALNQKFSGSYEIIVINDGSPDETSRLLAPLHQSGKIRLFEQVNAGQASARNRGISEAKGDYIAFLDDDDLWPPGKLDWQYAEMLENPDIVLTYGFAEIQATGHTYRQPATMGPSGKVFEAFAQGGYIRSPGQTLIRSAALRKIGGFDDTIWGVDDWDLYLQLAKIGDFKYENRCALIYREHDSNATLRFYSMFRNSKKVRNKHFSGGPNRSLFKSCNYFIKDFVTWDGTRCFDLLVKKKHRFAALGCLLKIIWVGRINLRQIGRLLFRLIQCHS